MEIGVSRFHDELPFAQPTQSFGEERRQNSLQVRLAAPERAPSQTTTLALKPWVSSWKM
jgi:hypothetical protein